MWLMPSYGRPHVLRSLLSAPGGWPETVIVLVNRDDPAAEHYAKALDEIRASSTADAPWKILLVPAGSRCADAYRFAGQRFPNEPYYGLLADDLYPITPGWHEACVKAAGVDGVATPNGEPSFPRLRNAVVLGGDLVRAMGSLVPAPVKHNYEDDCWDQIAADFNLLRPVADVFVEHRHPIHGLSQQDATYIRASHDFDQDKAIYGEWLRSQERVEMCWRIAAMLGVGISAIDPKTVRLGIATPIQNETVDIAYHKSLNASLIHLASRGISVNVIEAAGGSHVGKARERVLWENMRRKPTHVLFIDADMGWKPELVTRLLCADHDFCAAVGVKKQEDVRLCANFLPVQNLHPVSKFLEVRDVGFAFVLLKVGVIEKMCAAYPELEYKAGENREWALFLDMLDEKERLSEDYSFCRRWRAIGGQIWVDPHAALVHAGRKEYTGKVADLFVYEANRQEAA